MKRKRFATEQIIKILKEAELGIKIVELCRKYGIAEQTFYNWQQVWRHGYQRGEKVKST